MLSRQKSFFMMKPKEGPRSSLKNHPLQGVDQYRSRSLSVSLREAMSLSDSSTDYEEEGVDLTVSEEPPPAIPLEEESPRIQAYNAQRYLAESRNNIAYILLGILAFVVFASFVTLCLGWVFNWPATRPAVMDLLQLVFAPLVGLVGAVTGFYFGQQSTSEIQGSSE
jgi:hypothetical protein